MMSVRLCFTVALWLATAGAAAEAQGRIRSALSGRRPPFSTAVARSFGAKTEYSTPVVESTGSGGLRLFCGGIGS